MLLLGPVLGKTGQYFPASSARPALGLLSGLGGEAVKSRAPHSKAFWDGSLKYQTPRAHVVIGDPAGELQQIRCQQRGIVKNLLDVAELVDRTRTAEADDVSKMLAVAYWDENTLAYLAAALQSWGDVIV
jgi:hypothetical protein